MKGDVLSGFDTLKACTSYNYKGENILHFPYNIEEDNVKVNMLLNNPDKYIQ